VSTRYAHAVEVLARDRGLLVDFRSAAQLAAAALRILQDPALKDRLEQNAYAYGRETAWPRVAARMLEVLRSVAASPPAKVGEALTLASPLLDNGTPKGAARPQPAGLAPWGFEEEPGVPRAS
jgi:hypothetical protein